MMVKLNKSKNSRRPQGAFRVRKTRIALLFILACVSLLTISGCQVIESALAPQETEPTITSTTQPEQITIPTTKPDTPPDIPSDPPPQPQELTFADYWLSQLTLEEKIGQLIMPRLPWQTTVINTDRAAWLYDIPFGGFILFSDNVESISQVQTLVNDLQAQARLPLFISTDEEGGRVSRVGRLFGGATPSAYEIGGMYNIAAYEFGRENAHRLQRLGINMNFAPVADVWSNPANAVIGNRAFGHSANVVGPNVAATVEGLQSGGVFATLKHFPGHGDTYEDSHYQLAFHNHDINRFWEVEALPFKAGIEAGATLIMTGHISTPQISGHSVLLPWMEPWIESGYLPATFSDFWLQEILRNRLGFEGLIITDGLEMRALTDHFTCGQIALGAFLAGADILLIPANPTEAFQALLDGYHQGYFDRDRLNASVRRILQAKEGL